MKKNKNFSYKIFGVSIADIFFVVLLAVLVILAIEFSAPKTAEAQPGDVTVSYTVELFMSQPGRFDNIRTGEKVYDSQKGYEIGVITDVYEVPFKEDVPDFETDTIKRVEVDGLVNVMVEVEAVAAYSDAAIAVGQYELQVGKDVYLKNKDFAFGGYIVMMDVKQ